MQKISKIFMTSSELYEMLVADVQAFNDWRVSNADLRIDFDNYDFSEKTLTDAVFINMSLRNANFSGANIEYTSFCHSDATGANFQGANAGGAHFGSIENSDVRLPQSFLAHLSHAAILDASDFTEADLEMANFRNCPRNNACFQSANTESVVW